MSTTVIKRSCHSQMATPVGSTKPRTQTDLELMDVNLNKHKVENVVDSKCDMTANGNPKADELLLATVDATTKCNASETSRILVDQAKRRLKIQMQFVENARKRIENETHPDMTQKMQLLLEERDRLLRVAKQRGDYFEHGTSVIFNYECDEANAEYELQCGRLRQDMLDEINHEMEILHDQQKGGHTHARATTRKTRSTRNKPELDLSFVHDTAQKIKKRAGGYVFQPLENRLGQLEIDQDVRELTTNYEATKKRRMEFDTDREVTPVAKYYRNKFLYRDWIFQEGDEIYVFNYLTSSEYAAVICGIASTELLVVSEEGKYHRLIVMDIRQGHVVLTTLSSEQTASREDLDDASP